MLGKLGGPALDGLVRLLWLGTTTLGVGGRAVRGGGAVGGGGGAGETTSVATKAGLRRSMETVSSDPLGSWMVKTLSPLRKTLKGPRYGLVSGGLTAELRTYTWVQVRSAGSTWSAPKLPCQEGAVKGTDDI